MKIAVLRERFEGESRVAATPETIAKLIGLGAEVTVEKGAGDGSRISDEQYKQAGAAIGATGAATLKGADIVLCVRRPAAADLNGVNKGALVVGVQLANDASWVSKLFGFIALVFASVNIFGGFLVTQRMLAMYKKKG